MSKKQSQVTLTGGTVEDYEKGKRMLEALFSLFTKPKPIIGFVGWQDSITEEQKQRILIERMKQLKEANGKQITEATDYEALIYIMTASLAAPLSSHHFNIYAFLFRKFYPDKAQEIFEEHEGRRLDPYMEEAELKQLKTWLWKTQQKP